MTLALHNKLTGETTPVSPAPLTQNQILLLPGESPEDFTALQNKWKKDFPGKSNAILALRDDLVLAEFHRARIRLVFQQVQVALHLTYLPMHLWDSFTHRHYCFHERLQTRAQREFTYVLKLLQDFHNSQESRGLAKARLEPPPLSPLIGLRKIAVYQQFATIKIVDGQIITKLDLDARHWLTAQTLDLAHSYCRHYYFPDATIPEPYAYVLSHNDETFAPARSFHITYSPEEFMRLCQLEIDTNSPYLLDGTRLQYSRSP
jgi:hypothetical protein